MNLADWYALRANPEFAGAPIVPFRAPKDSSRPRIARVARVPGGVRTHEISDVERPIKRGER